MAATTYFVFVDGSSRKKLSDVKETIRFHTLTLTIRCELTAHRQSTDSSPTFAADRYDVARTFAPRWLFEHKSVVVGCGQTKQRVNEIMRVSLGSSLVWLSYSSLFCRQVYAFSSVASNNSCSSMKFPELCVFDLDACFW